MRSLLTCTVIGLFMASSPLAAEAAPAIARKSHTACGYTYYPIVSLIIPVVILAVLIGIALHLREVFGQRPGSPRQR